MKKLHLAAGNDDFRQSQKYIQIKGGFVYATNSHVFVKFPLNEVFGENGPFNQDSEFYILASNWKQVGFDKALKFTKDSEFLTAYGKKDTVLGLIKMMDAETFKKEIGNYPPIDSIIPTTELVEITKISFNPKLLKDITDCLDSERYSFEFRGENKIIMIKALDSEVVAGIMPVMPLK